MKTLKVILKQHTPLIHFQHDQYGATLRASEVKPKLDKFIVTTEFRNNFREVKNYLQRNANISDDDLEQKFNDGFRALNYQLKIVAGDEQKLNITLNTREQETIEEQPDGRRISVTKYLTENFPMLLSNMGGKEDSSKLLNLVLHDYVVMIVISNDVNLLGMLKATLPKFFATTNFGQRSTKGFGSFTVFRYNAEKPINWDETLYYEAGCPYMGFNVAKGTDISEKAKQIAIMEVIDFYWKCLKAGINYTRSRLVDGQVVAQFPNRYIKSYLYVFLNTLLKKTWEKRSIKREFRLGADRSVVVNDNIPIFARGFLGCPDKYLYGSREVKVEHFERNDSPNKIDRIPAPIYFKPVCFNNKVYIYLLFDMEIVLNLRSIPNKTFRFTYGGRSLDLELDVFLKKGTYNLFLDYFHEYLSFDRNVQLALYSEVNRDNYYLIDGKRLEDDDYGFVPMNFNWNNILYDNQCVMFNNVELK